jgi:tetratricopeptide (TPR) repeat protein
MDPNNPVVKLCVEGMRAEGLGRMDEARALFLQAWAACHDDFDACLAAHYVARHQDSPQETLRWNEEALKRAEAVGDERVQGFYSSLYLKLGHSYEVLGRLTEARRYYDMAAQRIDDVPAGRYGDVVRGGIENGRLRIGRHQP